MINWNILIRLSTTGGKFAAGAHLYAMTFIHHH
jgi:hypothetical protein